jgi:D-glycero-alpha-D-manno-heptose-7-phosphate kinase
MYVYITVNKYFDDRIRIVYRKNEMVDCVDDIQHNIIREALKIVGISRSIEVIYMADIPIGDVGVGLASSSALAVGVLNALYAYKGVYASPEMLMRKACEIEINRLGQEIGIQDQCAAAYGGFRHYRFHNNGEVSATPVVCPQSTFRALRERLMLFYTGTSRDSRGILSEQKRTIGEKTAMLDSLVDAANTAHGFLVANDLDAFGYLLDDAWQVKKQFAAGVSNQDIDAKYQMAKEAGALGGKILGAGGGGFMLLYVPPERHDAVKAVLPEYRLMDGADFEAEGSRIIYAEG